MNINPCPRCGREPRILVWLLSGYEVVCAHCRIYSGMFDTRVEAVEKWNKLTKGESNETTEA
jgi:hypothetical protein